MKGCVALCLNYTPFSIPKCVLQYTKSYYLQNVNYSLQTHLLGVFVSLFDVVCSLVRSVSGKVAISYNALLPKFMYVYDFELSSLAA